MKEEYLRGSKSQNGCEIRISFISRYFSSWLV